MKRYVSLFILFFAIHICWPRRLTILLAYRENFKKDRLSFFQTPPIERSRECNPKHGASFYINPLYKILSLCQTVYSVLLPQLEYGPSSSCTVIMIILRLAVIYFNMANFLVICTSYLVGGTLILVEENWGLSTET